MSHRDAKEEGRRTHFAMIPRLVEDLGLSQKAYRLYGHLKHLSGEKGKCEEGVDAMAKKCGMSKGTLIAAKRELEKHELIEVVPAKDRTRPDELKVLDVWARNAERYAKRERGSKEGTRAVQSEERGAVQSEERKKRVVQKNVKDTPPKAPPQQKYKPSGAEYKERCEAFFSADPLAEAVRDVADRAAGKNQKAEMSWSRTWNGFIQPVIDARTKHTEETIRYALEETNRMEKDDMRYALAVMRNVPSNTGSMRKSKTPESEDPPVNPYSLKEHLEAKKRRAS